tara:strand:- start:5922 stop:6287 length:366 start_codon:yes stop_codon:yes gene_type:complete
MTGRPSNKAKEAVTKGNRGVVGRPKGDAAVINEYKARMLASPKSRKVLDSILDAALDDDHKHQAVAWKIVADRILPVAAFEKGVRDSGGKSAIQINITGVGGATTTISGGEDVEDAEYTED